jgi:hypothetical protein
MVQMAKVFSVVCLSALATYGMLYAIIQFVPHASPDRVAQKGIAQPE